MGGSSGSYYKCDGVEWGDYQLKTLFNMTMNGTVNKNYNFNFTNVSDSDFDFINDSFEMKISLGSGNKWVDNLSTDGTSECRAEFNDSSCAIIDNLYGSGRAVYFSFDVNNMMQQFEDDLSCDNLEHCYSVNEIEYDNDILKRLISNLIDEKISVRTTMWSGGNNSAYTMTHDVDSSPSIGVITSQGDYGNESVFIGNMTIPASACGNWADGNGEYQVSCYGYDEYYSGGARVTNYNFDPYRLYKIRIYFKVGWAPGTAILYMTTDGTTNAKSFQAIAGNDYHEETFAVFGSTLGNNPTINFRSLDESYIVNYTIYDDNGGILGPWAEYERDTLGIKSTYFWLTQNFSDDNDYPFWNETIPSNVSGYMGIGSHGYNHTSSWSTRTENEQIFEMQSSKNMLNDEGKNNVIGWRTPGLENSNVLRNWLYETGYKYDTSYPSYEVVSAYPYIPSINSTGLNSINDTFFEFPLITPDDSQCSGNYDNCYDIIQPKIDYVYEEGGLINLLIHPNANDSVFYLNKNLTNYVKTLDNVWITDMDTLYNFTRDRMNMEYNYTSNTTSIKIDYVNAPLGLTFKVKIPDNKVFLDVLNGNYRKDGDIVYAWSDTLTDNTIIITYTSEEVNDQPWWDIIPNNTVSITEDMNNQNITLGYQDYFRDVEDNKNPSLSIIGTNTSDVTCAMSSGDIQCSPANNFTNSFILTINGTDSGYLSEITSFEITVTAVNDAPWWNETSNTTYSYNEDFGFDYTVWDEDGLNNTFWDVEDNHLPYNCTASTNDISIITNVRYNGSIIADSVASGQAILTVNCSDSGWLSAVTNFEITINAAPIVTIQSPQNVTYNYSIIDLNVSADEPIDTWYYSLNEGGNITFSPNSMIFAKGGSNYLVVYANDTSGNINSSEVYFTVDLVEISVSESPIIDTDKTQYWESGSFDGTQLNNSYEDMILLPGYSSGNFTSAVFDAGSTVVWNNISWVEILPTPQNTITMNPTHAEDEFGVDITSYVNVSDGINTWGRVEVQTWTDTVPVDATIDSVVGYCEVEFIDAGAKIGFQTSRNNGTSWDSEVCVQDAVASTTFECDLKANSSVDTADEVNNLRLRCTFPLSNESKYYSTDWVHVVTQYESSVAFSTDLKLQVRSDDDNSDWSPWLGPDGTGTAYYTNADGENLNVSNNRYFQYKVEFETDNIIYSPELHNVAIAYTSTMIDSIPPDVTLNLPEDNATLSSVPVTFNCSATDNVQLKSITLYGNWTNQLFYDDFSSYAEGSDGSENWDFENYGGNQTVEGGEYHFHGNTAEEPISIRKNFDYNDYAVEAMVKTTTLTGNAYICPRYDTVRDKYEIAIDMRYSTVSLSVVVNDVWTQLSNVELGWTIQNNTWYSLKAKITTEGNTNRFLIYVNDTLYINQTDSSLMNNGKLAILTYSLTDRYDIYFDNVTVSGEYWFANETKTITGTDNSTTFSQSISDGAYSWNCYACDNSSNCAFAATNRTFSIGIDTTPPTVNLELPENNTVNTTSNTIDFTYNISDLSSVSNCSLIIDGSVNTTSTSITKDVTQNLTTYLDNGEYNWLVNCTDQYNNIGNSETRNISINVAQDTTPPTIYLELPADNATNTTTNTIDFTYNVSDVSNLDNCTLIIENSGGDISINVTDTAMLKDIAGQNLTTYLTYDDYEWSVNCTDEYNNIAGSEMRNVSVFITVGRPTELSITLDTVDNKTVILNWTNATNVEYFNVYITDNYIDGFSSTPNFTGITELGFIDGNAPAFKKLFYKVSAVNGPAEEFIITSVGKIETYQLEPGFHLLSLPLNISNYELNDGTNNGYKFTEDQPDCISSLFMYDGTNFLQTINEGDQIWVPATGSETFTTLNTSAHSYWFEIAKNCNITFAGIVPNENLTVALDYEWQVVGWYSPYELPLGQESVYGNPISVNPSGSVRHLYRYNSTSSSGANWDMMTYFDGYGWWPAYQDRLDFTHLQPNSGYYFHNTPPATWTHDPTQKPT